MYDITNIYPSSSCCLHFYTHIMLAFYKKPHYICKTKGNKYEYSPETVSCCRKHLSVPIR